MAKEYVDKLTDLMADLAEDFSSPAPLEIKHFFSGAAGYAAGRICITFTPVGLALKLPEALRTELLQEKDTKHLRYFPKAPVKKDYVVLPQRMIDDRDTLRFWLEKSVAYVLTLPRTKKNKLL